MFDRFSDDVKRAMGLARQEAQRFNHEYIGTEHILLGLLGVNSEPVARIFRRRKLDADQVRKEVEKLVKPGPVAAELTGHLPFTPRARKVLEFMLEAASASGDRDIDTHHLLVGLVREREGIAAQALLNLGLSLDDIRAEMVLIDDPEEDPKPDDIKTVRPDFSRYAGRILAQAIEEAKALGRDEVASEHLLLALLSEKTAVAGQVLRALGVDSEGVRREADRIRELGEPAP